jgi:hypothetical protein
VAHDQGISKAGNRKGRTTTRRPFRVRHHFIAHENIDRMPCTVNRPVLEQLLHDWPLFDPFEMRHAVREFGSLGVICPGF